MKGQKKVGPYVFCHGDFSVGLFSDKIVSNLFRFDRGRGLSRALMGAVMENLVG